jgi:hypothetical protein
MGWDFFPELRHTWLVDQISRNTTVVKPKMTTNLLPHLWQRKCRVLGIIRIHIILRILWRSVRGFSQIGHWSALNNLIIEMLHDRVPQVIRVELSAKPHEAFVIHERTP